MPAGDVYEVAIPHYHDATDPPDQCAVVIWHFRQTSTGGNYESLAKVIQEAWGPFVDNMGAHVRVPGVYVKKVLPDPGPRWPVQYASPIYGIGSPVIMPKGTGVRIYRQTAGHGRDHRGTFVLPWVPDLWADDTDPTQLSTLAVTNLQGLFTAFTSTITGGGDTGTSWWPVVYSSRALAHGPEAYDVVQIAVQTHLRMLTKRSRRVDPCPPFAVPEPLYNVGSFIARRRTTDVPPITSLAIRGLSDFQDNFADLFSDGETVSDPGYSDAGWNSGYGLTAENPPVLDTCHGGEKWSWPNVAALTSVDPVWAYATPYWPLFHHYHDSPTGDSFYAYPGEGGYVRMVWHQPSTEIGLAILKHNGDDWRRIWMNGVNLFDEAPITWPAWSYDSPELVDVTSLLIPGATNCVLMQSTHGVGGGTNDRPGTCALHPGLVSEERPPWVCFEIAMWEPGAF